jgi:hypothetical protein
VRHLGRSAAEKAYTSFKSLVREQFFMRVKSETPRTTFFVILQDARLA